MGEREREGLMQHMSAGMAAWCGVVWTAVEGGWFDLVGWVIG